MRALHLFESAIVKSVGDISDESSKSCDTLMAKVDDWVAKLSVEIGDKSAHDALDYQHIKLCLKRIKEVCNGTSNDLDEHDANIYYRALCTYLTDASKTINTKYDHLI